MMGYLHVFNILLFFLVNACFGMQCSVSSTRRVDCFPETFPMTEADCANRGCCYSPYHAKNTREDVPWCFFPDDFASYAVSDFKDTDYGFTGTLKHRGMTSYPPNVISTLQLDVYLETPERLHFKITDPLKKRFEVPIATPDVKVKTQMEKQYKIDVNRNGSFAIVVRRSSTNTVLFNTSVGPLLFGDQFLQISTSLASSNLYGLGERHESLKVGMHWHRIPFWAADRPPGSSANLYGDHPFYMVMEEDGNSHGVFFLNSNAKEAELQSEPALTWRSIGGVLDFYIFLGPMPDHVISQYTATVGRPFMPPLWSLGFHLCRWGYKTANVTMDYVTKMRDAKIPQDVQWNDIDYMIKQLDFTYDPHNFDTLPQLLENLHSHGQHYVMIVDPGISDKQPSGTYPPYDTGLGMGIYVNDSATIGRPARGVVWPGEVSFPDFSNPKTEVYWLQQLSKYHSLVSFDGVWIDMNEPSNFVNGSPDGCPKNSSLNYPPYVPKISGGTLFAKTLCPSTVQHKGMHYDVHSLTGLFEMKATSKALISIRDKRPFVISRSTFPSAGLYGGHWTGDILSTWEHMRLTIPAILGFNMFGIPLVGADICGFALSTTEELCTRWSQLGAFYPFSRNHNDHLAKAQAPVDFSDETQLIIQTALRQRYSLIPYLYTLFHLSHKTGAVVARPLFFEFPHDTATLSIDAQFMWGSGLLITPVLTKGATSVEGYFPAGVWYDIYMKWGSKFVSSGQTTELSAPIQYIPLHVRGGCIIPGAYSGTVTDVKNPFFILAAADRYGNATGNLYWDDGDSLDTFENGNYVFLNFTMQYNRLTISLDNGHKDLLATMRLHSIIVIGLPKIPSKVTLDGKDVQFSILEYDQLYININMPFKKTMVISWI